MIVVTLTYKYSMFDLQLPTDIPVGDLLIWMLDYVNLLTNESMHPDAVALLLNRKEDILRTDMTLDEAGVRNGDYITILRMG